MKVFLSYKKKDKMEKLQKMTSDLVTAVMAKKGIPDSIPTTFSPQAIALGTALSLVASQLCNKMVENGVELEGSVKETAVAQVVLQCDEEIEKFKKLIKK